ncbi:MAG: ABC transporter ATP-binding protein [Microbacterium sp. 71-36]|uniref:ABC transporter ATP-binding protein n=1 Tax=unclassified Microbacterium TaxID=2609290 RepID=UPI000869547B|nr:MULTISPECIES: ABC transporter ATP-binding protein [unclassified Microbacterium]MBN9211213.1 ABC transporter ATP-binding protein [Microbacterium sp.]ODT41939.1 MAG: ABC transporter ATP-binding protein [Microbacterium sp. SCN 71-17]OJV77789.1 MAG: ABC transporter ATP-binding protein [Microbacterium sp. 71-36]
MTQPAVRLSGVSRRFRRAQALDDVTLDIPANAITGLLGRNGAGKTTLMSIIAGHDRPSSGSVQVFGTDPFEDAATMSSISFVRDNQRYPDDFTLRQVLEVAPHFHAGWDADVAEHLVHGFRLPRKTAIKKLSRGQASSLGIVLGLSSRAPLTIFDEPYLGLDATARRFFYDTLMQDYLEHPRTILVSTHLIDEMEPLLEHVVIVDEGRLVRTATADDLRGSAVTLSGTTAAVDEIAAGHSVLQRRVVGGLSSLVLETRADEELRTRAARAGAQLSPATLQDLVAAYGVERDSREGTLA